MFEDLNLDFLSGKTPFFVTFSAHKGLFYTFRKNLEDLIVLSDPKRLSKSPIFAMSPIKGKLTEGLLITPAS